MPLGPRDAAHLLRRAGFGPRPDEITAYAAMTSRAAAVDALLAAGPSGGEPTVFEADRVESIQRWWLDAMRTGNPVTEKLAFFWHGHFCSSVPEVDKVHILDQIQLFRRGGSGDFRALAQTMAVQPAMLSYLDNASNLIKKDRDGRIVGVPQENFARELLELFLLGLVDATGKPNYTEADVKACARAWTGHTLRSPDLFLDGPVALTGVRQYQFQPERHDDTSKTFLGVTKNWNGPDIIDHLCTASPWRTVLARHVARKLFGFYAYPEPDEATIAPITAAFAQTLNVLDLVRAILTSEAFWSERARTGLVRTPVDFTVAGLRATGLDPRAVAPDELMPATGQALLHPPNVSGWRPNGYWLTSSAIQARADLAQHLVTQRVHGTGQPAFLPAVTSTAASDPTAATSLAFEAFGVVDERFPAARRPVEDWLRTEVAQRTATKDLIAGLCTLVMLSPDFQIA